MRAQLWAGFRMFLILTIITGILYPLAVLGASNALFSRQANGSVVTVNGTEIGSRLLGQNFTDVKYFHARPSAAGNGYDATASGGSNLGPTSEKLLSTVAQRVADYRAENNLASNVKIPIDAVTASGSGLDPDISVANANFQAHRIASARGISDLQVQNAIKNHTSDRAFGFLGEPTVNVLSTNLALDNLK